MAVKLRLTNGRGASTPLPVSATVFKAAAFCALLVTLIDATFAPVLVGVKVTLSGQLAPGATLVHTPVCAN